METKALSEKLFPKALPYTYDISGPGYGISKGSPFIQEKALNNKFIKKGFKNCHGLLIRSKEGDIEISVATEPKARKTQFINLYFNLPLESHQFTPYTESIINQLKKIVNIEYGYGYPTLSSMNNHSENYLQRSIFGSYYKNNEVLIDWENNLGLIEEGIIQKLHHINIVNLAQLEKLSHINFDKIITIDDGINILTLNDNNLKAFKNKVDNGFN